MLKAYKFRLNPAKYQKTLIGKHIDSCSFVYNWALEQKIRSYEQTKKSVSKFDLNRQIPILKKDNPWLTKVNSQSLQGMTTQVENAFTRFFREKNGFPKFKSKRNPIQSFPIPQHYPVDFEKGTIKLPKIGNVKAFLHRIFEGALKTATLLETSKDKYFLSILVDDKKELPEKQGFSESTTLGVDVGIMDFAVLSNGEKIENPKFLKSSLKRLKVIPKRVSRKQKGSNNRRKGIKRLAKICRGCELLKTVNTRISLHFPQIQEMYSLFRN